MAEKPDVDARDIILTAEALRSIRRDLADLLEAIEVQDAARFSEIFVQLRDTAQSAHRCIRRVAIEAFPNVVDDDGRLREVTAAEFPWLMQTRPRA